MEKEELKFDTESLKDRFFSVVNRLQQTSELDLRDITEEEDISILIDKKGLLIILNRDYLLYARRALLGNENYNYFLVHIIDISSGEVAECSTIKLDKPFKVNTIIADEIEIETSSLSPLGKLPGIVYSDLKAFYNSGTGIDYFLIHLARLKYKGQGHIKYFVPFECWVDLNYIGLTRESWLRKRYDIFEEPHFLFDNIHNYEGTCEAVKLKGREIVIEKPVYKLGRYFADSASEILEDIGLSVKKAEQLAITPSFIKIIADSKEYIITYEYLNHSYEMLYDYILDHIRAPIVLRGM